MIETTDDALVVEFPLPGIPIAGSSNSDGPAMVMARFPHHIVMRSYKISSAARNLFILGSVSAILSMLLTLQFLVVSPLNRVRDHFNTVSVDGITAKRLSLVSDDEIGDLSRAFDSMIHRLGEANQQLTHASKATGRSEIAATVIHNVGNVLTNVNSLIDTAADRVRSLRVEPLQRLANQLQETDRSPELVEATPMYLECLATKWSRDQDELSDMLATLEDNVRHIHDIIRDQQKHANSKIEYGLIEIAPVIEEAISCCQAKLAEKSIRVRRVGNANVRAIGDASLLVQTIINVISNAAHAMMNCGRDSKLLTLAVSISGQPEMLSIAISDTGCGMTADTIKQAFDAHFTLREDGTGLGLHFCANAIKQLGGTIHATSDGKGKGSTVVIRLARSKDRRYASNHSNSLTKNLEAMK